MSEHLKFTDLDLSFRVGKTVLHLADQDLELTSENSTFWTFDCAMLNHVVWQDSEGGYHRIYIDPSVQEETFMQLAEAGITHVKSRTPSDTLLEQWWEIEMDDLDREMDYYEAYGEYPSYGG